MWLMMRVEEGGVVGDEGGGGRCGWWCGWREVWLVMRVEEGGVVGDEGGGGRCGW